MIRSAMSPLTGWENFYVILGSAAAGLMGLTFVVIVLIAETGRSSTTGLRAFVTPTVVHFGTVLGLAAFLSMPRLSMVQIGIGLGLAGSVGIVHATVIALSMRSVTSTYVPVREDWIWHVILPALAYIALAVMAPCMLRQPARTLYGVGSITAGLLFIGIHNAWDVAVSISLRNQAPVPNDAPK